MQLTANYESQLIGASIILCPPPAPNTKLILNGDTRGTETDFDVVEIQLYRAKPLNRFQRWAYKVCFGIEARNI